MENQNLISVSEAAAQLDTSPRTIQRLCNLHQIGCRVGRQIVLTGSDVDCLRTLIRPGPGNPDWSAGSAAAVKSGKKAAKKRWREVAELAGELGGKTTRKKSGK